MASLEKILLRLKSLDRREANSRLTVPMLILTVVYLIAVLSVPLSQPQKLVWFFSYPILYSEILEIGYKKILVKSLWILPIVIFIGMFNPILDTTPAFKINSVEVSAGWVSFFSIILRGLLSFQALLLLVQLSGIIDIFNALRKIGCPKVLVTQLQLSYRYLAVIVEEALVMRRAREARGFGKKSYPFRMWSQFVGQLLIRSSQRATGIHRAMLARGFHGTLPSVASLDCDFSSYLYLFGGIVLIALLRFTDITTIFLSFTTQRHI